MSSLRTHAAVLSDLHITGHGHWHCGSMVPILSKLFLICWFWLNSTKNDKVKNTHLSPVPFYFYTMFPCSWRRQLRAAVKSKEAHCSQLKFLQMLYVCYSPFGDHKEKNSQWLTFSAIFWSSLWAKLLPKEYMSNYPDLPSWVCLADNSYQIVLILEKRGCVTMIQTLVIVYICQSLLTVLLRQEDVKPRLTVTR